jgi:hypothetical protein
MGAGPSAYGARVSGIYWSFQIRCQKRITIRTRMRIIILVEGVQDGCTQGLGL